MASLRLMYYQRTVTARIINTGRKSWFVERPDTIHECRTDLAPQRTCVLGPASSSTRKRHQVKRLAGPLWVPVKVCQTTPILQDATPLVLSRSLTYVTLASAAHTLL